MYKIKASWKNPACTDRVKTMAKTKKYDYVVSRLEYQYKETRVTIMTKRQRLEKEILVCIDMFKQYDINYLGLLMCDLYLVRHSNQITKEIISRVETRIGTLNMLKTLGLLKKEIERDDH